MAKSDQYLCIWEYRNFRRYPITYQYFCTLAQNINEKHDGKGANNATEKLAPFSHDSAANSSTAAW